MRRALDEQARALAGRRALLRPRRGGREGAGTRAWKAIDPGAQSRLGGGIWLPRGSSDHVKLSPIDHEPVEPREAKRGVVGWRELVGVQGPSVNPLQHVG